MTEKERPEVGPLQLYQIGHAGPEEQPVAVAHSLAEALMVALTGKEELAPGEMLLVWNVTSSWLMGSRRAAAFTERLLKEGYVGLVSYDDDEGWMPALRSK